MDTAVVATYRYRHEAEFALARLEAEGIAAMLSPDDAGGAYPGIGIVAPVRLLVRSTDVQTARAILDQDESDNT